MNVWPAPQDELGRLTAALCDEELSPDEAQRLEQLVEKSDAARRWFRNYVQLHAELYWEHAAGRNAVAETLATPQPRATRRIPVGWIFSGTAVAALLLAAVNWGPGFLGAGLHRFSSGIPGTPSAGPEFDPLAAGRAARTAAHIPAGPVDLVPPQAVRAVETPIAPCVARFRQTVAAHPQLLHHYPFEGATVAERLRDRRGDLDLLQVVMGGGQGLGTVETTMPGFDATTNAIAPYRAGNAFGAALQSQNAFQPPREMTVELLLCFTPVESPQESLVAAAVATRSDARRCAFLVAAVDQGQAVHLLDGEAPWTESHFEFASGEWYYLASTFQSQDDKTLVSTYVANLTRGETRLTPILEQQAVAGVPAASALGIGKGFNGFQAHAYPWSGSLDEVAIYQGVLLRRTLEQHLHELVGKGANTSE